MIVIADTSPLYYLILVRVTDVLPKLFQRILIPDAVWAELRHPHSPAEVRQWIANAPEWLEVQTVPASVDPIPDLDAGEEAAIRLAQNFGGEAFLLIDDAKGRREATRRRIPTTGTLGVLQAASKSGLLLLRDVMPRLMRTNFYISAALVESLIAEEENRTATDH
jgi:predicted nucleic acid-binding protein